MKYIKTIKAIYFMKQHNIEVHLINGDLICLEGVPTGPAEYIKKTCQFILIGDFIYIPLANYNALGIEGFLEG